MLTSSAATLNARSCLAPSVTSSTPKGVTAAVRINCFMRASAFSSDCNIVLNAISVCWN
ncbi:Uncharacterised protein [Segatella copri]|nr:Uncharacterised protein [Segatella copri]